MKKLYGHRKKDIMQIRERGIFFFLQNHLREISQVHDHGGGGQYSPNFSDVI